MLSTSTIPIADVCLILEGTYPYVRGGVASWVDQLIKGLPEISFAILAISADRRSSTTRNYVLPSNVISFAEVYIHELIDDPGPKVSRRAQRSAWSALKAFHEAPPGSRGCPGRALLRATAVAKERALSVRDALGSFESWKYVMQRYTERARGSSFLDYFWTWRAVHAPLFQTLIAETPPARIYHAVSTGYAGLLGVIAKLRTGRPLILTEHGIYVRERNLDVARAQWIYEEPVRVRLPEAGHNPLKEMWKRFFTTIGKITYDAADLVVGLFEGNAEIQRELGADPAKLRVIPNGVDVERFARLRGTSDRPTDGPLRVGFIGRVVPIKDVLTLLRAFARVERTLENVELWIVGPTDEDENYYRECLELTEELKLKHVRFMGTQDVQTIYPQLDLMVLSSVSEGQPLSILEASCAGVPTVATDVGACRELLEGRTAADRALGPSGLIAPVGDAEAIAQAILTVLKDSRLRSQMREAGCARVEHGYRQTSVLSAYRDIYQSYLSKQEV